MITNNSPTHLTCPYCPAQAYPSGFPRQCTGMGRLLEYKCPANHRFYIVDIKEEA